MATVLFDFDSTIISCESLEKILKKPLSQNPKIQQEIKKITEEGMRGKISFEHSLAKRLEIIAPTKQQTLEFGQKAHHWLTKGMEELIHSLHNSSVDVWIVSGGIIESLLTIGKQLDIPENHIHGVKILWNARGSFVEIDDSVPFCRSKVEGCKPLTKFWSSPKIAVGDAVSDYRLYEAGLVDHFIAYTEHFRCEEVLVKDGVLEAKNTSELQSIIRGILDGQIVSRKEKD